MPQDHLNSFKRVVNQEASMLRPSVKNNIRGSSTTTVSAPAISILIISFCKGDRKNDAENEIAYKDTTLVFSEPVPNLDKQATLHYMACADSVNTPDGGKTWNIRNINVQKSNAPEQYGRTAKSPAPGGICGK